MKTHKATYTVPEDVLRELNTLVAQRKRSRFVADAVRHALELEKRRLEEAYIAAAADEKREEEIEAWTVTEVENF